MISTIEKVLFLKEVELFKSIPSEELYPIALIADVVEHRTDTEILTEGDEGDAMYLIVNGEVKVHSGEHTLAHLGRRECLGEMAILDSAPRSASVTALTDLTLLIIRREDFREILAEKPEISQGIVQVLTHRLREANKR